MPMAMTTPRGSVEAARAAGLTVHSAAGLLAAASPSQAAKEALRLLRAADGLCRAAVVTLVEARSLRPTPIAEVQVHVADAEAEKGKKKRRRRKKRKKEKSDDVRMKAAKGEGEDAVMEASVRELAPQAEPGGSLVFGDLSELGLGSSCAVILAPPGAASSAGTTSQPVAAASSSALALRMAVGEEDVSATSSWSTVRRASSKEEKAREKEKVHEKEVYQDREWVLWGRKPRPIRGRPQDPSER